jgi:hypothetical protein
VLLAGGLLGLSAPAAADEACAALDVTCEVTLALDDAEDAIGDSTDEVTGTVEGLVGEVDGIVRPPGDPGPGGGGDGSDPGGRGEEDGHRGRQHDRRADVAPGPRPPVSPVTAPLGGAPGPTPPNLIAGDSIAATVEAAAKGLLALVVGSAIAAAFATIQQRIDRDDPKLALAPTTSDVVEFA